MTPTLREAFTEFRAKARVRDRISCDWKAFRAYHVMWPHLLTAERAAVRTAWAHAHGDEGPAELDAVLDTIEGRLFPTVARELRKRRPRLLRLILDAVGFRWPEVPPRTPETPGWAKPVTSDMQLITDPKELAYMMAKNNPDGEPTGHYTGRCMRCGSRDLWDDAAAYGCNYCGEFYTTGHLGPMIVSSRRP